MAQYWLGHMYGFGCGVPRNDAEAVEWHRKAADQGYAPAENALGLHYAIGLGVTRDLEKAVKWHHKAAEQGMAESQLSLGVIYRQNGDTDKAIKWFNEAAEQGHRQAQYNLGMMYAYDDGSLCDETSIAMKLCYSVGPGNNIEALKWLLLADWPYSTEKILRLKRAMSFSDKFKAHALADEWREKRN